MSKLDRALWQRYKKNHAIVGKLKASNYDITSLCNLRCEGCLYFSGDDYLAHNEISDLNEWDKFFKNEAARGINYAYIAGAEPSFVPDRIRSAYHNIPRGVINTNGTRKIDYDIRYRIHVSLWGDENTSEKYRGVNLNKRALQNYSGDKRAIVVMTINGQNIGEIMKVSQACANYNIRLTFSYFSATNEYLSNLRSNKKDKDNFFRISSIDENFLLDKNSFLDAESLIQKAMNIYPKTVLYSMTFNKWVTQAGGLYDLDANGLATNCLHNLAGDFKHFSVDLQESAGKCCTPNIACSDCRAYAHSYANYLKRYATLKPEGFEDWLNIWELWTDLFMPVQEHISPYPQFPSVNPDIKSSTRNDIISTV